MIRNIKGRGRIILALIVMLLTLAVFTTPAFASWSGDGSGTTGSGTASGAPIVYSAKNPFLWRVTLYVSTNADGKIKETDTVASSALKRVGETIYYDGDHMYNDLSNLDYSFVQVESSVPQRVLGEGRFNLFILTQDGSGTYWSNTPETINLATNGGKFKTMTATTSAGKHVNIFSEPFYELFNYSDVGNYTADTDSKLKGSQAGEYTTKIVRHMAYGSLAGDFWSNVKTAIHSNIKSKVITSQDAEKYLLPAIGGKMNPDCLVDYALVVESMMMYECKRDISWKVPNAAYATALAADPEKRNFAVDAFWLSIINKNYNDPFKKDLGDSYGTTAARCHDTYKPEGQSHHGVICSHISSWADAAPATYAIRGVP